MKSSPQGRPSGGWSDRTHAKHDVIKTADWVLDLGPGGGVKVSATGEGRAVLFHWLACSEVNSVERGWLNLHRVRHGYLPVLNTLDSPVSY